MKLPFILAKRFVAGETFNEAVPKVTELNNKSIPITLDLLGENVNDRETADKTVNTYIELLDAIKEAKLDSTISIKLTMIGLDIDHDYCIKNLFILLDVAKKNDQFIRIDMEGSDYTQITIDIFIEAFKLYGKHVGIVIQAYLHRTKEDISLLGNMGADVRLCKGAYKEPAHIALQNMDEIREAYIEYAKVLIDKTNMPRIATHDEILVNWLKKYAQEQNIEYSRFEFQMLYGLRQDTMEQLTSEGYNTRIYVPFGTMWFPYFKRRLMERKENIWFIFSTMFKK